MASALAVAALPAAGSEHGSRPNVHSLLPNGLDRLTPSRSARLEGDGGEGDESGLLAARAEFSQSITAAPARVAPAGGLVAAARAARALPVVGGRWREVTDKPFLNDPINRGINGGVGWHVVTGRMTAMTASKGVVYAGSAGGGVWRSTDKGLHWRAVNAGLPRLAVGALSTDPRDGSVWVGTGEANNSQDSQYGVGVFRLAPGASRWHQVGGRELFGAGSHRILWARGFVYIATTHGLFRRSVHASMGSPWKAVLQAGGASVYPPSSDVTDVVTVPGSGGRKLLAVNGWLGITTPPATEGNGFYVGGGAPGSFHRIHPTGAIDLATLGRTTLSRSGGWLYAVAMSTATQSLVGQGVYVSKNGPAGPWRRIATSDKLAASDSAMSYSTTRFFPGVQAWYNQNIVAEPGHPRHVYLQLEEVYESTNAGRTWHTVGPYWNFDIACEEAGGHPYACPPTTHPDQHAGMIYHGQFWAGSDGGVWRRPLSWHDKGHWKNLNSTLHTIQNYSVDLGRTPQGNAFWGGLQDNGEAYTRADMSAVEQAFTGDGGDTIVNPSNGDQAVEEYVFLAMIMTRDAGTRDFVDISPSCTTLFKAPITGCDPGARFIAPIEKDVNNPRHWLAGGQFVWDDTKAWNTVCDTAADCDWQRVYDTGTGHSVTALAANGGTSYAAWCGPCNPEGFTRGLATNSGGTWHEVSLAGVGQRYITSMRVDPEDPAHVFLSLGSYSRRWIPTAGVGHVFESMNGGRSWRNVTGNLPDMPVYHLAMSGDRLVAGTEVGAFVARLGGSGGLTWSRLGHGLPNVTVWDVVSRPGGLVAAGTHGRGEFTLNLG